jgi:hypothetical protein
MATTTTRRVATEEALRATPEDGHKHELVDGEIRVSPAGDRHSLVAAQLVALRLPFVKQRQPGFVFTADAGFRLPSGNWASVAPDLAIPGLRVVLRDVL